VGFFNLTSDNVGAGCCSSPLTWYLSGGLGGFAFLVVKVSTVSLLRSLY